ncbi:hypothetical protein ACIP88_14580 [Streptomyces uncialis]|uniref:hypothetical protein n=1 Tax=Streptomyces uncialis TaxID=1048205 RepID=UPI003828D44B
MQHRTTVPTTTGTAPPFDPPSLGELLTEWAQHRAPRERAAVAALVADRELLARDGIRTALIVKQDGRMACDWARLARRHLLIPDLTPSDRAFLTLVLAIAQRTAAPLGQLDILGAHRLTLVLRALAHLGGSDTIALGERA